MKKSLFIFLTLGSLVSADQKTENFAFTAPSSSVGFNNVYDLSKDWELKVDLDISPYAQYVVESLENVNIMSSDNGALKLDSKVKFDSWSDCGAWLVINDNASIAGDNSSISLPTYWGVGTCVDDGSYKGCNLTISYSGNQITITAKTDNGGQVFAATSYTFDITFTEGTTLSSLTTGITQDLLDTTYWFLPTGSFTGTIIPQLPAPAPIIPQLPTTSNNNGSAGNTLINDIILNADPEQGGALSGLLNSVYTGQITEKAAAAAAGSSTPVLGQALNGDVERQLRAIRNRAAMGQGSSTSVSLNDGEGGLATMPEINRYFVWVNAEGNRSEQDADGTAAGYTLTSWGGTLGAGMQVSDSLTLGLALTAMIGDLDSDAADTLDGDMDTTYLSAFARYQRGAWSHTLVGTAGTMEADYKRTVSHATGSYHTDADTDGTALGLMYELSRSFALSNRSCISPVFNIAYRHTEVDAYRESGADAALNVGEQELDTVTLGLGARYNATVGQLALNRSCDLEARALAKCDLGDRQSETTVNFINQAARADIESAEMGTFGLELGGGLTVPVGRSGSLFADGAVELRSDYTNFNATVGYKVQF